MGGVVVNRKDIDLLNEATFIIASQANFNAIL